MKSLKNGYSNKNMTEKGIDETSSLTSKRTNVLRPSLTGLQFGLWWELSRRAEKRHSNNPSSPFSIHLGESLKLFQIYFDVIVWARIIEEAHLWFLKLLSGNFRTIIGEKRNCNRSVEVSSVFSLQAKNGEIVIDTCYPLISILS